MAGPHSRSFPAARRAVFWQFVRSGLPWRDAALAAGVSISAGRDWYREVGGVMPPQPATGQVRPRLTFEQREDIADLRARGSSNAEIAREIGVHPSTIGRELVKGSTHYPDRQPKYRASLAQAQWRAGRPQASKLAGNPRLRAEVQDRLDEEHSPEQIAARLKIDFPHDPEMHGAASRSIKPCSSRAAANCAGPCTNGYAPDGRCAGPAAAPGNGAAGSPAWSIADRPPEVEGRAVPGHREGDLIVGTASRSAIGTLVERMSGFTMLLHLPHEHGADTVAAAMTEAMSRLPKVLRRTLTWDQGSQMRNHVQIAAATDLDIYFCDPHSPWQRGTNENTNGLLRQYFPKGTDLSVYAPDYLDHVARKLNNRPRKRHGFKTPAEVLDELLSNPLDPNGVASTA